MSKYFTNPILPGYYPDPSVCRVGEDYYLCCSSFEMYPGLPVFHSRDLVHWELLGHAVSGENGFHVSSNSGAGGVMAPTIRHHNGKFYIINANFSDKGNFIITAVNPAGPWSEPHYLEDVPGIDASIFFDDDGQCYIIGTGNVWDNGAGQLERGIWAAPYDIESFRLLAKPTTIFNSGMRGAASPEAPHLYHIGDYYYLLIAEGGTEHYHSVVVARAKNVLDFYESDPANPVMTHRMMGTRAKFLNVGHADLVDTPSGAWYAVLLGSRSLEGCYKNLGRETYLCPVEWEWDWPLFSPETGCVAERYSFPPLPEWNPPEIPSRVDFDGDTIPGHLVTVGTPYTPFYTLADSRLRIRCIRQELVRQLVYLPIGGERRLDRFLPFIGCRQTQFDTAVSCRMAFVPRDTETAGLALLQAMNHQLHFERALVDGQQVVRCVLVTTEYDMPAFVPHFRAKTNAQVLASAGFDSAEIVLKLEIRGREITLLYGGSEDSLQELCRADMAKLATKQNGCLVGTLMGMFASGNGRDADNQADFDWFEVIT